MEIDLPSSVHSGGVDDVGGSLDLPADVATESDCEQPLNVVSQLPSDVELPPDVDSECELPADVCSDPDNSIGKDISNCRVENSIAMESDCEYEHSDIEMPPAVDDGMVSASGYDDAVDIVDEVQELQELNMLAGLSDGENYGALNAEAAQHLRQPHGFAELYSQPRVCKYLSDISSGVVAVLSLDILTGWDFLSERLRTLSLQLLVQLSIGN